jgi:hypothetical protein
VLAGTVNKVNPTVNDSQTTHKQACSSLTAFARHAAAPNPTDVAAAGAEAVRPSQELIKECVVASSAN